MIERITILGTGLIGASVGLALRSHGFTGSIAGWDPDPRQLHAALTRGAIGVIADDPLTAAAQSDLILLGGPVFTILEWLDRLAPVLTEKQLVTDVGSVKAAICDHARHKYNGPGQPGFLPGHPMAGKEVGGAANADAALFLGSVWLFTELSSRAERSGVEGPGDEKLLSRAQRSEARDLAFSPLAAAWRAWVAKFGCRVLSLDPARHDILCAWISHLPQFVSTAMAALLEDEFAADPDLLPIGGRALREMTRLGSSPFSMWRDIAHTNTEAIAHSLQALEQRLAHLRENLKTPELRDEFDRANHFRLRNPR
ncbi:MAG TPA: prephenate dehydrogenase/arogenate dehydrogenase family protein [Acidobacteriaceae bacterium]|jgi:prephenate dehydrogenase|nr:prephenate dehydrogenase/arogenate dehydrogenase family protein [Acidobacteriaceae bacterium]